MKILGVAILFLFFGQELFAQTSAENFRSIFFKKRNGGQIVFSGNIHSFTIDIDSTEIKSTDRPGSIIVGNKMLQYELVADTVLHKSTDPKEHLTAFLKGRLSYAKHQLKQHYTNSGHDWLVINNKTWLVWYYDLPGEYGSLIKQINLSTVCFSHILNLSLFSNTDDKASLTEIAQTLKQNDFTINFDKQFKALSDLRSF
ncbi:MAG TPA: hypothetical protein VNW95_06180 [Mucilaginibacter sp.]|jgi:hypothetical protein|nr:hypothetical protein [Mucilaginibacter sp.]